MEILSQMIGLLIGVALCVAFLCAGFWSLRLLVDGKFSREGVDIVMFAGLVTVHRLKRQNIQRVRIAGPFDRLGVTQVFLRISLVNRLKKRGVAVWTKSGWIWFFTPADPEAAVRTLGIGHSS